MPVIDNSNANEENPTTTPTSDTSGVSPSEESSTTEETNTTEQTPQNPETLAALEKLGYDLSDEEKINNKIKQNEFETNKVDIDQDYSKTVTHGNFVVRTYESFNQATNKVDVGGYANIGNHTYFHFAPGDWRQMDNDAPPEDSYLAIEKNEATLVPAPDGEPIKKGQLYWFDGRKGALTGTLTDSSGNLYIDPKTGDTQEIQKGGVLKAIREIALGEDPTVDDFIYNASGNPDEIVQVELTDSIRSVANASDNLAASERAIAIALDAEKAARTESDSNLETRLTDVEGEIEFLAGEQETLLSDVDELRALTWQKETRRFEAGIFNQEHGVYISAVELATPFDDAMHGATLTFERITGANRRVRLSSNAYRSKIEKKNGKTFVGISRVDPNDKIEVTVYGLAPRPRN